MRRALVVLGSAVAAMASGCSSGDGIGDILTDETPGTPATWTGSEEVRGNATVLQGPDHGPQLCWAVADSMPPQCSGPDVVGWDWEAVEGEQSATGTTWGSFQVTGTWDGERLTLTRPPGPPDPEDVDTVEADQTSPCPEPTGGWAVVNRAATNQQTLDAATLAAQARPDIAAVWLDQSINPASADPTANAAAMNDPLRLVLNVRVAGDVDGAERDIRAMWGGALCVSEAEHTRVELQAIGTEVDGRRDALGLLGVRVLEVNGVVEANMVVEPAGLQAELDEQYGPGTVVVTARLQVVA